MTGLPEFVYHPDPLGTGSAKASDEQCACCARRRGHVYTGPVYSAEEPGGRVCLWCIADGSAAERFDADFCDALAPDGVARETLEAITKRTPGFVGWQQERWLFHCGDGAAFLGPAGAAELRGNQQALDCLRAERTGWPAEEVERYLAALDRDGQPTAYLFQCRSCQTYLAYSDFT